MIEIGGKPVIWHIMKYYSYFGFNSFVIALGVKGDVIKKYLEIKDGPILGELLNYLSKELAYKRLNNFDEAIYKAKRWIEQNAPKCD